MLTPIVFAKKLAYPSKMANVVQSFSTSWALADVGHPTEIFPRVPASVGGGPAQSIGADYSLAPNPLWRVRPLRTGHKGMYGLGFRYRMLAAMLRSKPTAFYARDLPEARLLLTLKRFARARHPVVFEMHGLGEPEDIRRREVEAAILRGADGVVAIGAPLADQMRQRHGQHLRTQPTVIPLGFNPTVFANLDRPADPEPFRVVYFGSLYAHKGVDALVESLAHLPGARLTIIGDNPGARLQALRDLAEKLGIAQRMDFVPHTPPAGLRQRLGGHHAIAIPLNSTTKAMSPIKLFEAMATGLPIVATPMPQITSILEHDQTAHICADATAKGLADGLNALRTNPARAWQLGQQAAQLSAAYTWHARAQRISALFAELTAG